MIQVDLAMSCYSSILLSILIPRLFPKALQRIWSINKVVSLTTTIEFRGYQSNGFVLCIVVRSKERNIRPSTSSVYGHRDFWIRIRGSQIENSKLPALLSRAGQTRPYYWRGMILFSAAITKYHDIMLDPQHKWSTLNSELYASRESKMSKNRATMTHLESRRGNQNYRLYIL
jgi:hypothetical protein